MIFQAVEIVYPSLSVDIFEFELILEIRVLFRSGTMATIVAAPQGRYATLDSNLGFLQEMVRKDPASYKDDFEEKLFKFQQRIRLFDFNTTMHRNDVHTILELVTFISGVASYYPEHGRKFADQLTKILRNTGPGLDNELRLSFAKAVVTLRNKKLVSDSEVFDLFFELVKCEDKSLRQVLVS